ncbi:aryl-sulfate sulfotransferase [Winogradskyella sp.]|uniref:aryl-sulfate sulfotransferase n=1 Tax=Winogradskyella sp. TaxID=1883156 RepID=UPI0025E94901|nr:aryl-sulfate sulfotransferase [Winogradskyella sp.]
MMIKKLLVTVLFIAQLAHSQNTVGNIQITDDVFEGYTLFTVSTESYLINNCGQVINQWSSGFPPGNAVYLMENGNLLRAGRTNSSDISFGGQGGVVEMYNWEGNLIWQYFYDTPEVRQHHDVFPMPNGNILILAATRMTNAEAIQAGRNPVLLTETDLYNERIIEVTPLNFSEATIVWEWNINDHLVQDFDNTKDNFGDVSLSPNRLDINFLNGGIGGSNWLHINSIQYNEALDQIVLSSRNLSEIYIIDHSTTTAEAASSTGGLYGKGGDFLYRWGNPQSYDQGTEADRILYGQHYPYIIQSGFIDEGKIILFNNGNGRSPSFSEAMIINPPISIPGVYTYTPGMAFGPIAADYIYTDPVDQSNFFSHILSSAQRLSNGNTLICEGTSGRFFEITPSEDIAWEYIHPINSNSGSIANQGEDSNTFQNYSFRANKYPTDYAAFTGRDLTPGDPIELNFNLDPCNELLNLNEITEDNTTFTPNPTKGILNINTSNNISKIEVYNALGNKLIETTTKFIDLSDYEDGMYFLKVFSNDKVLSKKIIKI